MPVDPTWEPAVSFETTFWPVASSVVPSAPAPVKYGGADSAWERLVESPGSGIGPPTVRGAQAGEPTIDPVKIRFTQLLSEKM